MKKKKITHCTDIQSVIENDLCITCGACVEICPESNLITHYDKSNGAYQPKIVDVNVCSSCSSKPCEKVCQSLVNALPHNHIISNPLGSINLCGVGYSSQYVNNKNSSSGGLVKELVKLSLECGYDVICLSAKDQSFNLETIENISSIDNLPGSIYHSVDLSDSIKLIDDAVKPVAIVAIPCLLEGLELYYKSLHTSLDAKVSLKIGIICGWSFSHHSILGFSQIQRLKHVETNLSTYRGGGDRKGSLRLFNNKNINIGTWKRQNFDTIWQLLTYRIFFSKYNNRMRCRLCVNHVNKLSDISLGDVWVKSERRKVSLIVTRSSRGLKALDTLIDEKRIEYEEATSDLIIATQSNDLVYGTSAVRMHEALQNLKLLPTTIRFQGIDKWHDQHHLSMLLKIRVLIEVCFRYLSRKNYILFFLLQVLLRVKSIVVFYLVKLKFSILSR